MSIGLKTKTIAMTINTMVSAPWDQYRAVMDITIPKAKAEMNVPLRLPIPPTMTTANAKRRFTGTYGN